MRSFVLAVLSVSLLNSNKITCQASSDTTIKALLMNDIHLDLSESNGRFSNNGEKLDPSLLQFILDDAKSIDQHSSQDLDVIFMSGDFCMHGLAADSESDPNQWPTMELTIETVMQQVVTTFPTTPILPSIGNNDVPYHDQAPTIDQAPWFYGSLWKLWFEDVPANKALANDTNVYNSFMSGGYYSYMITEDIMFISLNSMYMFSENNQDRDEAVTQLDWLETTFASGSVDTKFIIQMHVFFGLNWFEGLQQFWYEEDFARFIGIINTYQDRLMVALGSHIHTVSIRAPKSKDYPDLKYTQIINPAVSPIYSNNPSYSWMTFSNKRNIQSLYFRQFQLSDWYRLGVKEFSNYDPVATWGINLNDPDSIREWTESLRVNRQDFAEYISKAYSMRPYIAQMSSFFWMFNNWSTSTNYSVNDQIGTYCAMMYNDKTQVADDEICNKYSYMQGSKPTNY